MRKKEIAHLEDLLAEAIALRRPMGHPVQTLVEFVDLLSRSSRHPSTVAERRRKWDAAWILARGRDWVAFSRLENGRRRAGRRYRGVSP